MRGRGWVGVAAAVLGTATVTATIVVGLGGRPVALDVGPTQMVSADPETSINSNTSPVVVVDPRRPGVLVTAARVDAPHLDCTLAVSTTGGQAWRKLDLPRAREASNCFWPDAAFDGDGRLLVLYTPTGGPYNLPQGLWLQRFTPDLTVDGAPVRVAGPLTFQPRLAVDGGRVLVAWIGADDARLGKALGFTPAPNPLVVARSDDGGRTFAPPVTVGEPGRLVVQPTLRTGPGGHVVVGALDLVDDANTYQSADEGRPGPAPAGPWRVVAWTSPDGGSTFGGTTVVADRVVPSQRVLIDLAPAPAFAVDPTRGRVYAAWESAADVVLSRSDDGGGHWSAPRRIGPATNRQFLPGIGVSPDGRVDVAFYDRSRDRTDIRAVVVLASSSDGGATFQTATVSDQDFDSQVGSFAGGNVMLGSHLGVASEAARATVVWADTARGNRVNNIVDLVSATADVRPATGGHRALAGTALAVAVVGLALTARSWPGRAAGPGRRRERRPAASPRPRRRD